MAKALPLKPVDLSLFSGTHTKLWGRSRQVAWGAVPSVTGEAEADSSVARHPKTTLVPVKETVSLKTRWPSPEEQRSKLTRGCHI